MTATEGQLKTVTDRIGSHSWMLALGSVCLIGLALRVLGLGYGLPAVFNPDETPILNRALAFAKGDLNPHNFLYPSVYFYAVFAWETLFFLAGRAIGLFSSLSAFQAEFFTDPSRLFLAARAFTVLCGTLTIAAVYWLGSRLYGRSVGLAAALFYAVAPIAVRDAHYIKLDVPVALPVVLAHVALARLVISPEAAARRRSWFIAGLLGGLAVSTQYYVGLIVFSYVVVAAIDVRRSGDQRQSTRLLVWAGAGVIAGFFLGTPFMLVEPQTALRDMAAVREIDVDRAMVTGAFVSTAPYLKMLFRDALGWPVCVAAAVGMVWAVVTDWRRGLLLVTFPVLYFAFLANTVPMTRYLNAMLPSVALAAAFAVTRIAGSRFRMALAAMLVVLAAVPGLVASVRTDLFFRQTDTRALASEFIERNIADGSSILIQPQSAPLHRSREGLMEALRAKLGSPERASIKFQLQLAHAAALRPSYRLIYLGRGGMDPDKIYVSPALFTTETGIPTLQALNIEYVVLKRYNVPDPAMQPFAAAVARHGRLLATFSPYRADANATVRASVAPFLHNTAARIDPALERPGPIVEVWRLDLRP